MPTEKTASRTPEWVTETREVNTYALTLHGYDGETVEDIEMTRNEYINLKRHLAKLRGLLPAPEVEIYGVDTRGLKATRAAGHACLRSIESASQQLKAGLTESVSEQLKSLRRSVAFVFNLYEDPLKKDQSRDEDEYSDGDDAA